MSNPTQGVADLAGRVTATGVIGIVRSATAEQGLTAARTLLDAGLDVVEISLVTPDAVAIIAALIELYPAALVGAGTVVDRQEAQDCIRAGARLLVSPIVDQQVIAAAVEADVLAVPGANTPTECLTAVRLGAPLVKLFPASTWTPAAVADLLSALPALRLVPTGGVRIADAQTWYDAGAVALGIGSALTSGTPAECADRLRALQLARRNRR